MTWQIMKSMFWNLVVFIPSLVAFASAFHCFLMNNDVFEAPIASLLKTFAMFLGEVDFSDNFLYNNVKETEGANGSVQFLLIIFIIYGVLIIMNLIVALMVDKTDAAEAEIILAKQRIEEISSMADFILPTKFFNEQGNKYSPNLVCISATPKEVRNSFFGKIHRKWKLKDHHGGLNSTCTEIRSFETVFKFYPRSYLVKDTIEMLKTKLQNKEVLMKEVKSIQEKTEERLKELVFSAESAEKNADGEYITIHKETGL